MIATYSILERYFLHQGRHGYQEHQHSDDVQRCTCHGSTVRKPQVPCPSNGHERKLLLPHLRDKYR